MKQYIINSLQRLQNYSKQLDAEAVLWYKKWWIFNDEGEAEVMIFRPGNELLVSRNGVVTRGKWELNINDSTLLVEFSTITYLFQPAFIDDNLFALRPNGVQNNIVVMIDEANRDKFKPQTFDELNQYFDEKIELLLIEDRKIEDAKIEREKMGGEKMEKEEEARKLWEEKKWKHIRSHPQYKEWEKKRIAGGGAIFTIGTIIIIAGGAVAAYSNAAAVVVVVAVVAFIVFFVALPIIFSRILKPQEDELQDQLAIEYEAKYPKP
jgi:hypothetical protein